ncbi:MAG TPA: DEAD/DEAH box helicase [Phycisphaerae bacterium]|nr:DEAD/DEAH box helicase [Phycisphaerae bacterium]
MEAETFIKRVRGLEFFRGQVQHVEALLARPAEFASVPGGLHPAVRDALKNDGITQLYCHQAEAIGLVRQGRHVVIVTGTASGKTLCYNVPIVEAAIADPSATAFFLYPTKALAQDQLRGIGRFHRPEAGADFLAGTYDGDTPQALRRKLRNGGNFILTNPDMLHQGILPNHARWNRFLTRLRYVVVDEVHAYRGVFGSHLANVLRRLGRICRHYGSQPQFICCSATIANPREHAERITGKPMELVTHDGSPRGPKRFVLWNPPPLDTAARGREGDFRTGGDRRSPLWEAVHLMAALVREGIQTIAFTRTRLAAELIYKNCRDLLRPQSRRLADSIRAYRGGYLPEERREIERQLVEREILGVASTNALELGIDIGSLDACIMVGYPGTVASLWQQAGRAGRGLEESIVFLVGQNSPTDQYLMTHCGYLFAQNPEQAVVDPDNPHIAVDHIRCAAHELPLADAAEGALFGPYTEVVLELLAEDETVRHIDGNWYWACSEYPAAKVNLRNIAGAVYTIQDEAAGERVIGTMDEVSALSQLHDHAVYLHAGETYFVNKLDLEQKIAFVERRDLDYYTQSVQSSQIRVEETAEQGSCGGAALGFGDVTVTTTIPMFKKIRFHSRDSLGFEKLELPSQTLETVAVWLSPSEEIARRMKDEGLVVGEGLIGIANVMVEVAQLFVMCDAQDIGTVVDAASLGRDSLFLYDRYPGGMGYARRCMDCMDRLLETVRDVIAECSCEDGCPSCVGAAVPAFAQTDLDSSVRGRIPDKRAAGFLLRAIL